MTPARIAIGGIVLIASLAAAAAAIQFQRGDPAAVDGEASRDAVDEAIADTPGGRNVPLRFFKDPALAPAFTVQTLDGRTLSSADLRGKVVLVNFWATWCPPCRAEIPDLIALQEKYRDQLTVIGISEDEGGLDAVQRFSAEQRINYPIAMVTPDLARAFPGVVSLPTSFVIDREGRIVQRHVGMLDPARTELEARSLAGLPVNASIEYVEPDQPVGLANAAQAKEIPGIDLTQLSSDKRVETLLRLNAEACSCGCGLTVARCRIEDPACGVSLPLARRIAAEIAAAPRRPAS